MSSDKKPEAASKVDPWTVGDDVDFEHLKTHWGLSTITPEHIERLERITGEKAHHWLRRGIYYAHRDLDKILDAHEKGEPYYLYTGRGPSSEFLHIGHLIPFHFTQWLQKVLKCPLVIQLTDDEKSIWKGISLEKAHEYALSNIRDIIACGFDPALTFIFIDTDYIGQMYKTVLEIQKSITYSQAMRTFGFKPENSCAKVAFPAVQMAPCFPTAFPQLMHPSLAKKIRCFIPCAVDQEPYFRVTRDVAKKKFKKPSTIYSKFLPSLTGSSKMSSSAASPIIGVKDSAKKIKKTVNKYAFSGGGDTIEDHRKNGGNVEVDVPYKWLCFFEPDDEVLADIRTRYSSGEMLTGQIKHELIVRLQAIVQHHRDQLALVTDEMVEQFMTPKVFFPAPEPKK